MTQQQFEEIKQNLIDNPKFMYVIILSDCSIHYAENISGMKAIARMNWIDENIYKQRHEFFNTPKQYNYELHTRR